MSWLLYTVWLQLSTTSQPTLSDSLSSIHRSKGKILSSVSQKSSEKNKLVESLVVCRRRHKTTRQLVEVATDFPLRFPPTGFMELLKLSDSDHSTVEYRQGGKTIEKREKKRLVNRHFSSCLFVSHQQLIRSGGETG